MLEHIPKYKFFTKLDISMKIYTFELGKPSQDFCIIAMPFGNYKYKQLPMGLKWTPGFAQQVMDKVVHNIINNIGVYLDDIGAFFMNWEHHIVLLDKILNWLEANGFTVNLLKCKWAIKNQETDWLGY